MDSPPPSRHLSARTLCLLFGTVLLLALLVWKGSHQGRSGQAHTGLPPASAPQLLPPTPPLPGELILRDYAQPATRPEDDLSSLAHAFSNLTLLIKGDAPFRLGANEEFAAALRGRNRDQLRFLPDTHPCFNASGQLIDRWGSPLFFHVNDRTRIDLRSAGPDRQMWTRDDLHRRHDGQFHRGKDLPPARDR